MEKAKLNLGELDLENGAHINPYLKEAGLYNKWWLTDPQPMELFENTIKVISPPGKGEVYFLDIIMQRNGLPAFVPDTPEYRKKFDQMLEKNMPKDTEEFKKQSLENKIYDLVEVLLSIKDEI